MASFHLNYLYLRRHRKLVGSNRVEALWTICSCFDARRIFWDQLIGLILPVHNHFSLKKNESLLEGLGQSNDSIKKWKSSLRAQNLEIFILIRRVDEQFELLISAFTNAGNNARNAWHNALDLSPNVAPFVIQAFWKLIYILAAPTFYRL